MCDTIFSRSYLQGLPLEIKRAEVSRLIDSFIQSLLLAAGSGSKNYLFDMTDMEYVQTGQINNNIIERYTYYTITIDEMIPLFQEKFPDCTISYQEFWLDTKLKFKVQKKGIFIDWS